MTDISFSQRSMMNNKNIRRWEIWYARVKFEESNEYKDRPVLVYKNTLVAIISFKMTSVDRGDNNKEYQVREWEKAGLDRPTTIRLEKVLKLEEKDFIRKIGKLTDADRMQLELRLASRK